MTKALFAASALLAGLFSTHAFATNTRTWISGKGIDQTGCGPITSPCRTLQYAHDNTSAGGEIDVLDPAGYGSVSITKSISIINDGVGTAGVLATSGNAITINAGPSDSVILRGLTIEGANTAANGIEADTVGSLTIANCVVQGFMDIGIVASSPSGTLRVFNTSTARNQNGLQVVATGATFDALLDHVVSSDNRGQGFLVSGESIGSGLLRLTVSNSLFSSNSERGIRFYSAATQINAAITDSVFSMNSTAMELGGTSPTIASIGRNTIVHNAVGIIVASNSTGNTFGNNQFQDNGFDVSGTLTPITLK